MSYAMFVGCGSNKKQRKGFSIIWLGFIWAMWKVRNNRVFNNTMVDAFTVVDRVQRLSWQWFLNTVTPRKGRAYYMSGRKIRAIL
jgi:hypothetical protein